MSKQDTIELINSSMLSLMEFSRKSRGPIKGFRSRDLSILIYIYTNNDDHQVTMSQLAQNLRVTPAAASQIISGYEKNGWVKRVRSTMDRRTVYIQITDQIKEKMLEKWNVHLARVNEFLDELGPEDCENFHRILQKMIDFVQAKMLEDAAKK